jgi:hypothetical protein
VQKSAKTGGGELEDQSSVKFSPTASFLNATLWPVRDSFGGENSPSFATRVKRTY